MDSKNPSERDERVDVEVGDVWVARRDDVSEAEKLSLCDDAPLLKSLWEDEDVVRRACEVGLRDEEVGRATKPQMECVEGDAWAQMWVDVVAVDGTWAGSVVVTMSTSLEPWGGDVSGWASEMGEVEAGGREWVVTRETLSEDDVWVATGEWQREVLSEAGLSESDVLGDE
ncbi:hypothetical protein HUG10_21185 (plasmid) [Halorarum halophilum]|uniref:Uncharacterized protein n=1 Tax=Halorarum halophilum TaxID=2743090 RepID=A0A7D5L339_9EURY|nr:hypothetical protein [Halobaculum halophilum]QLG30103.1 hypothetical protein HUG10_21185 [Halobaculum halophilum]